MKCIINFIKRFLILFVGTIVCVAVVLGIVSAIQCENCFVYFPKDVAIAFLKLIGIMSFIMSFLLGDDEW